MSDGNRVLYGEGQTYPRGLTDIPLASYMRITRYQYNDGLKRARSEGQQGVGAGVGQSTLLNKDLKGAAAFTFGGIDKGNSGLDDFNKQFYDAAKQQLSNNFTGSQARNNNKKLDKIKAGEYKHLNFPLNLQDGTVIENAESLAEMKNQAGSTADAVPTIYHLPMPNEFQYSYGASWDNKFKLGTMARLLDDMGGTLGQMLATGSIAGITDALGQVGSEFLGGASDEAGINLQNTLGAAFKGATDPLGINSDITQPANFLGLAGLAPNENALMMFSRMEMRSFSLSFEFFARDAEEAKTIDKIINGFKTGMHPVVNAKGTGGVLGFPDLFMLEPWFGIIDDSGTVKDGGIPHPMMPKTKMCALTGFNINSAPSNNFVTVKDGQLPLQTVSMTFNETTALTSADLETGKF